MDRWQLEAVAINGVTLWNDDVCEACTGIYCYTYEKICTHVCTICLVIIINHEMLSYVDFYVYTHASLPANNYETRVMKVVTDLVKVIYPIHIALKWCTCQALDHWC